MTNLPFLSLFSFLLIFGSLISMSSSHWFMLWVGLELNLMGFIPVMVQWGRGEEVESGVKYFLVQSLGSAIILMVSLFFFYFFGTWEIISESMGNLSNMILLGVLLKMGAAPLHFWLPSVSAGISWMSISILFTWQKLVPLFILSYFIIISKFCMIFLVVANGIIGGVGGINQTSLRSLLAYSSIVHLGWLLGASLVDSQLLFLYFFVYSLISVSIFIFLHSQNVSFNNQFFSIFMNMKSNYFFMFLMILSMGGMPPMVGFFMKWVVLMSLVLENYIFIAFILVMSSTLSLYYYLNLCFSMLLSLKSWKYLFTKKMGLNMILSLIMNLMGIVILWFF
uniref:NADH-ubiquinone oxidoreductase chain 2 n=1 Tax=Callochiton steinenii TaxID=2719128 RepID=A0A6H1PGV6_9MOLL|nr:NADH dehydrogenase subunit 2 [Callochiton steinenii]